MRTNNHLLALNLRAGEVVEVRSKEEILRTLDDNGRLDQLPFMPEMLKYCGKKFKVIKRADKVCDTIEKTGCRRMYNTVHLEKARCDGEAHGGCEAGCLLLWKEAWLLRADNGSIATSPGHAKSLAQKNVCRLETLTRMTRRTPDAGKESTEELFSCQATEVRKASSDLAWWDYRHYIRDITSGNRSIYEVLRAIFLELFAAALRIKGYRALVWTFNSVQRLRGGSPYPNREGKLKKTPSGALDLQPGELVDVKSHEEILTTLDTNNKNRGLRFDVEMVKYCSGRYKVLRKVRKIIDEKTGKMMQLPNDCLILDGVECVGDYHQLCPRSIFAYWREIWLKRVDNI
ncbi:MAG: hypothetical protein ACREQP_21595 [Candidatus Binatia bacterium]